MVDEPIIPVNTNVIKQRRFFAYSKKKTIFKKLSPKEEMKNIAGRLLVEGERRASKLNDEHDYCKPSSSGSI